MSLHHHGPSKCSGDLLFTCDICCKKMMLEPLQEHLAVDHHKLRCGYECECGRTYFLNIMAGRHKAICQKKMTVILSNSFDILSIDEYSSHVSRLITAAFCEKQQKMDEMIHRACSYWNQLRGKCLKPDINRTPKSCIKSSQLSIDIGPSSSSSSDSQTIDSNSNTSLASLNKGKRSVKFVDTESGREGRSDCVNDTPLFVQRDCERKGDGICSQKVVGYAVTVLQQQVTRIHKESVILEKESELALGKDEHSLMSVATKNGESSLPKQRKRHATDDSTDLLVKRDQMEYMDERRRRQIVEEERKERNGDIRRRKEYAEYEDRRVTNCIDRNSPETLDNNALTRGEYNREDSDGWTHSRLPILPHPHVNYHNRPRHYNGPSSTHPPLHNQFSQPGDNWEQSMNNRSVPVGVDGVGNVNVEYGQEPMYEKRPDMRNKGYHHRDPHSQPSLPSYPQVSDFSCTKLCPFHKIRGHNALECGSLLFPSDRRIVFMNNGGCRDFNCLSLHSGPCKSKRKRCQRCKESHHELFCLFEDEG